MERWASADPHPSSSNLQPHSHDRLPLGHQLYHQRRPSAHPPRPIRPRRPSSSSSSSSACSTSSLVSGASDFDSSPRQPSSAAMSSSRRIRDPRPAMDIKVLYTLDSSPNHTMVARVGKPVPVDVVRPAGGPPSSPMHGTHHSSAPPMTRFGRVTLKACLSAICTASPELIFDRKRDYIIYAVDPEETFRAAQQRSPTGPLRSVGHAAESSKAGAVAAAAAAAESAAPAAMMVGKGYFRWGLEEEGDGETLVSGKVRSEGIRSVYRDGRMVDESIDVLEVVFNMKETQARSKDQYYDLVRGFGSSSASSIEPSPSSAMPMRAERRPYHTAHAESRSSSRSLQLRSEPDYHQARDRSTIPPQHEQQDQQQKQQRQRQQRPRGSSRRSLAPAGDVFERTTDSTSVRGHEARATSLAREPSPASRAMQAPSPLQSSASAQQAPAQTTLDLDAVSAVHPGALHLLSALQTLKDRRDQPGQKGPEPQQAQQLGELLTAVAGALGLGITSGAVTGEAVPETTATPQQPVLGSIDAPSVQPGTSEPHGSSGAEGKENRAAIETPPATKAASKTGGRARSTAATPASEVVATPAQSTAGRDTSGDSQGDTVGGGDAADADSRAASACKNVCYNCGSSRAKTWRAMVLPVGTEINFPASEKHPLNWPAAEYPTQFAHLPGPIVSDGSCRWTACNSCGLYFLKWDDSRPRHMWDREWKKRMKREQAARDAAATQKRSSSEQADDDARKRVKMSQTDDEAVSPAFSTGDGAPAGASGPDGDQKASGLPRTLSSACQREAERLECVRLERERKREMNRKSKEKEKQLVRDQNGQLRSRRSVRENPVGRKAGRPKGTCRKSMDSAANGSDAMDDSMGGDIDMEPSPVTSVRSSPALARSRKPSTTTATSAAGAAATATEKAASAANDDSVFRAPAPPAHAAKASAGAAAAASSTTPAAARSARGGAEDAPAGRTVSFAQSSPVRPSISARNASNSSMASNDHPTPFDSPSRDLRFRVPNYLLNSSPGTMMDTLMSEADFDFEELGPSALLSTPGSLIGFGSGLNGTPTPLRRSPRKNPGGTQSDQNPFATHMEPASPSLGQSARALQGAQRLTFSSDESPVTRSRTKSGQGVLHPALFSSSDSPTEGKRSKANSSSNVTSPISPSPRRTAKARSSANQPTAAIDGGRAAKVGMAARKQAAQSRASGKAKLLSDGLDQDDGDDDDDDAGGEQLTKGPYRGAQGSPAGISRLSRKAPPTKASGISGAARLSHLDLPPSSPPTFDHPTTESANFADVEVDGWGRTPSMREMFPTPSDGDWMSEGHVSPTKPADSQASQAAATAPLPADDKLQVAAPTSRRPSASPQNAVVPLPPAHVARRPLPATVEDASTTSGSSPEDNDSPDQASNVFELFDDPYGLLAASGFGIQGNGMSADAFADVELHRSMEFGHHLNAFTQEGGAGVAAHVAPAGDTTIVARPQTRSQDDGAAASSSAPASQLQITVPASTSSSSSSSNSALPMPMPMPMPSTPSIAGDVASFFSSFPPAELTALFASPGKPKVGAQFVETLLSPRGKGRSSSSSNNCNGNGNGNGGGPSSSLPLVASGGGNRAELSTSDQEDIITLLNNPDIQAMLAEFGDLPGMPNVVSASQQQRGAATNKEAAGGALA
ncbi:uncharacterized protein PFL1_00688 [Pseudozyma flocculosa PF-1]|uniref:Ams2/SPT21 N-terminal domain-containing protein n=1 Tax=Pseudozyma flocculosa TaxID=84751 RepID=A0A5C3F613_9BASI|nr:uncharacterized protein PFL1_00688 [Pseudozyma flocculosa PF-1]EPQ31353.1 hypothetical protein PFL1_00688 [Pseudozyma flocculosa PF-1]SPO38869.1 uncharacterized protein PSFLO_04348 [Pseudozyma flocculosa]